MKKYLQNVKIYIVCAGGTFSILRSNLYLATWMCFYFKVISRQVKLRPEGARPSRPTKSFNPLGRFDSYVECFCMWGVITIVAACLAVSCWNLIHLPHTNFSILYFMYFWQYHRKTILSFRTHLIVMRDLLLLATHKWGNKYATKASWFFM